MKIISNYLFRTILNTSLLVFLLFIGLELFVFLMTELISLREGYGIREAFVYVVASLPSKIYLSMPIILLLGSLMGLARLATSSELVVMLTSAFSKFQVIKVVILSVCMLLFFAVGLGEWLGPMGERFAHEYKSKTFKARSFQPLRLVWIKHGNDFIHLGELSQDKKNAIQIVRFQFGADHSLKSASYAERALLLDKNWKMQEVTTTLFQKEGGNRLRQSPNEEWPISINLNTLDNRGGIAYQEPLWDLYRSIQYRKGQGLNVIQDQFLFWRRIWHPFSTLLMIAIASPFLFGSLRERSIGSKVVIGSLIALVFYALNAFFGPIAALFDFSPMLAAAMPSFLLALTSIAYIAITQARFLTGRIKRIRLWQ